MIPSAALVLLILMQAPGTASSGAGAECGDWRDCRERALAAAGRHDYETFHDFAWRAVQKGPAQDASLMYMLARAQSLSGRPHDALVMLTRLADRGVETDAASNEEFAAVRRLPQWPELEARLADVHESASPSGPPAAPEARAPASPAAPPAPASAGAAPVATVAVRRRGAPVIEEALRVPALPITPVALAHDRASGRFVFGDAAARKLVIVDERMHFVVDLVREASAGFYDITAFEIDTRRGDLWIVSADAASGATALHHLQMVSGRPIERLEIPATLGPGRFVDVAVTRDGTVYVLDASGPRLFSLSPRSHTLVPIARLDVESPSSIAPGPASIVYVAHRGGIARVDARTGHATPVAVTADPLPSFARIRWYAGSLLGIEPLDHHTCNIVQVSLSRTGGRIRAVRTLASGVPIQEPSATTVADDALYYVRREETPGSAEGTETVVKRLLLGADQE